MLAMIAFRASRLCSLSQLCLTLCDLTDCKLPGSSVHGDSPWILEWVPRPSSKGSSQPREWTQTEPPGKSKNTGMGSLSLSQGIFLIQESSQGLLNCRWILYQLNDPESPKKRLWPHGSGIELQPPAWQMRILPLNHPCGLAKESACQAGDAGLILRSGKSPGEGNGNPLQCSCLGNRIDRGNWRATVNGVTKESNTTLLVSK